MAYIEKKKKKKKSPSKELSHKLVYNRDKWRKLRNYKLQQNPLCEVCLENGKVTAATEVHHITSFMQGTTNLQIEFLGFDYNNLMSLCTECHLNKHKK